MQGFPEGRLAITAGAIEDEHNFFPHGPSKQIGNHPLQVGLQLDIAPGYRSEELQPFGTFRLWIKGDVRPLRNQVFALRCAEVPGLEIDDTILYAQQPWISVESMCVDDNTGLGCS